jgi:hypothetical protein
MNNKKIQNGIVELVYDKAKFDLKYILSSIYDSFSNFVSSKYSDKESFLDNLSDENADKTYFSDEDYSFIFTIDKNNLVGIKLIINFDPLFNDFLTKLVDFVFYNFEK